MATGVPRRLRELSAPGHAIVGFAIDPVADVVYTAGRDGSLIGWNFKSGAQLWRVQHHTGEVSALAVGEGVVCSGSEDKTVRAVEAATGQERWCFEGHTRAVNALAVGGRLVHG
eukprot:COSAG01_NODE_33922_length_556_cov_1.181619_1_plen_113_part_01